jgi:hypothetical protein
MKRNVLLTIMVLVALLLCAGLAGAQGKPEKEKLKDKDFEQEQDEQPLERNLATSPNVVVSVCISSGDIRVVGWDKAEVKVMADNVAQLELLAGATSPAQRVQVVLSNAPKSRPEEPLVADCHAATDLEISVPRGATVEIRTRSGDIDVSRVAEARISNTSGDIILSQISRSVEAATISGDVAVTDSAGRIRLAAISGQVEATNISSTDAGDELMVNSTSGDIQLENVAQARVNANTTSGMVTFTGKLAPRGSYDLNSFSGDVVLNIPANSSFRLSARAQQGDVVTDFAIKSTSNDDSRNLVEGRRLTGTVGTGDASLNLHTFNGTVRLQKR